MNDKLSLVFHPNFINQLPQIGSYGTDFIMIVRYCFELYLKVDSLIPIQTWEKNGNTLNKIEKSDYIFYYSIRENNFHFIKIEKK
ncbi:MAG: hypothetical protein RL154_1510 [Pseudomonadota bacterium]|jgi:hypothetical protein